MLRFRVGIQLHYSIVSVQADSQTTLTAVQDNNQLNHTVERRLNLFYICVTPRKAQGDPEIVGDRII